MGVLDREGRRHAAACGAIAVLLAAAACSGAGCSFDGCPDVSPAEAGHVTAADPSGTVRWTATVADLLAEPVRLSNGHAVVVGCHATHVVDVAMGSVSTPTGLADVLGVVDGYAVGAPAVGEAGLAAERLDGGAGAWSWQESPVDLDADRAYRASLVATSTGVVGVRGRALVAWSPASGSWVSTEVPLPVGAWPREPLVGSDSTHVVVPGSDGSVLGVDLANRSVTWRVLPTRPDAPAGVRLRDAGRDVTVEVWYPRTSDAAVTGEAVWVTERWSLDARTGRPRSPRVTSTGPRSDRTSPTPHALLDPVTGWTVTPRLREQPRGGCF
ncbi:hypothetical protein GCM10009868_27290 [Terrabacter aerolatus]|uniref:Uncharacterized protein n=1 Tax=Terrabacter aerolatus TaxID=422442 RepID=A0A512CWY2_9MICO|nr:hypothetical protein [Terrabacter aerolatus]GEO28716.1 hypothetical protein TAE01_05260 [Terrabacter aerolatus]